MQNASFSRKHNDKSIIAHHTRLHQRVQLLNSQCRQKIQNTITAFKTGPTVDEDECKHWVTQETEHPVYKIIHKPIVLTLLFLQLTPLLRVSTCLCSVLIRGLPGETGHGVYKTTLLSAMRVTAVLSECTCTCLSQNNGPADNPSSLADSVYIALVAACAIVAGCSTSTNRKKLVCPQGLPPQISADSTHTLFVSLSKKTSLWSQ